MNEYIRMGGKNRQTEKNHETCTSDRGSMYRLYKLCMTSYEMNARTHNRIFIELKLINSRFGNFFYFHLEISRPTPYNIGIEPNPLEYYYPNVFFCA